MTAAEPGEINGLEFEKPKASPDCDRGGPHLVGLCPTIVLAEAVDKEGAVISTAGLTSH